jgi:hypothetical protein
MTAHMPHGAYRGPYGPTWPVNPMKAYMDNVAHGAYENPYGHAWHVGSMRTSKGPAYYMRPLMTHMDPREPWGIWGEEEQRRGGGTPSHFQTQNKCSMLSPGVPGRHSLEAIEHEKLAFGVADALLSLEAYLILRVVNC